MRGLSVRLIFYSELSVENCALWRVGPLCRVGPLNVLAPTGMSRLPPVSLNRHDPSLVVRSCSLRLATAREYVMLMGPPRESVNY
jgi:hypothetical protein